MVSFFLLAKWEHNQRLAPNTHTIVILSIKFYSAGFRSVISSFAIFINCLICSCLRWFDVVWQMKWEKPVFSSLFIHSAGKYGWCLCMPPALFICICKHISIFQTLHLYLFSTRAMTFQNVCIQNICSHILQNLNQQPSIHTRHFIEIQSKWEDFRNFNVTCVFICVYKMCFTQCM